MFCVGRICALEMSNQYHILAELEFFLLDRITQSILMHCDGLLIACYRI